MRHVVAAFRAFHSLAQTLGRRRMIRTAIVATTLLMASAAAAASAGDAATEALTGPSASSVLAEGFAPFDKAAEDGWASMTPDPLFLSTATDKPAGAPLNLQPGAYRIVVLCDCNVMQVTLVGPDSANVPPERSDGRRAMYSLDVHDAASYLVGIDMDDCPKAKCDVGVKVYRKTS
jgi:hypothetical protein